MNEFKDKIPEQKKEKNYNIPEMGEIEKAMLDVCNKMKDELIAGQYDYIISDDKTGRIPSLIFKKVIEEMQPNKKISILHLAAGRRLARVFEEAYQNEQKNKEAEEVYSRIKNALDKYVKPTVKNKALVVTEYIHSGRSMEVLKQIMQAADIRFDIATLNSWLAEDLQEPDVKVFSSDFHVDSENPIFSIPENYAGIDKGSKILAFPELWSKVMKEKGKTFTLDQEKKLKEALELTDEEKAEYSTANEERKKKLKQPEIKDGQIYIINSKP